MRIPIGVVDDDRVGTRQVNAETSGSRREQEAELLGARRCDGKPKAGGSPWRPRPRTHAANGRTNRRWNRLWTEKLTVEAVNGLLPEAASNPSVNTLIFITFKLQKILEQIQHLCHLGEKIWHTRQSHTKKIISQCKNSICVSRVINIVVQRHFCLIDSRSNTNNTLNCTLVALEGPLGRAP